MGTGDYVRHDQRGIMRIINYSPIPTDAMSNVSYEITYNADDLPEMITKTIGTDTWQRTIEYTGTDLTGITAWSGNINAFYQTTEPSPVDETAPFLWVDTTSNPHVAHTCLKNSAGTWEYSEFAQGRVV